MFIKIKSSYKIILSVILFFLFTYTMFFFDLDIRAIAIITIVIGYITNIFLGLTSLLGMIPIIGPIIIKIFSIPFFWFMNLIGSLTSAYAIKRGYSRDLITHRFVTIILLVGIVIGYILGHLIPIE